MMNLTKITYTGITFLDLNKMKQLLVLMEKLVKSMYMTSKFRVNRCSWFTIFVAAY